MFGFGKKKGARPPLAGRVTGAGLAPDPMPRPFWIRGTTPDRQTLMLRANRTEVDTLIADLQKLLDESKSDQSSLDEPQ
jgi:hypothetical protein